MPSRAFRLQGRARLPGLLTISTTAIEDVPSEGHCAAHRPSGPTIPEGAVRLCGACAEKLTQYVLLAACPCASAAKAGPAVEDSPVVENNTQSTSSRSYSVKISGKCDSMPSAQPKRTPSTSKVTGDLAGRVHEGDLRVRQHTLVIARHQFPKIGDDIEAVVRPVRRVS